MNIKLTYICVFVLSDVLLSSATLTTTPTPGDVQICQCRSIQNNVDRESLMIFIHSTVPKKPNAAKDTISGSLSAEIFTLLDHYKQNDPVGLPMKSVPDPFPVDDVKKSIGMGTLSMRNTQAYGFSKFRIKSVKVDMNAMMVKIEEHYFIV